MLTNSLLVHYFTVYKFCLKYRVIRQIIVNKVAALVNMYRQPPFETSSRSFVVECVIRVAINMIKHFRVTVRITTKDPFATSMNKMLLRK